jgi:hypothetical protein
MNPDILVSEYGSIVSLRPCTAAGRAWMKDNLQAEHWQWIGRSLHVDRRVAPDIIDGMLGDGLSVEGDPP